MKRTGPATAIGWNQDYAQFGPAGTPLDSQRADGPIRALPFAGAELNHFSLYGSPKRAVVRGTLADGRAFEIGCHSIRVRAIGGIDVETSALDDVKSVTWYRPLPGQRLIVTEAEVEDPRGLGHEDKREHDHWDDMMSRFLEPSSGGGCVVPSVRFVLTAVSTQPAA